MCHCSINCNEWSASLALTGGACWSQSLDVSAGYTSFAVWSERPCSVSFLLCKGERQEVFQEHWGYVATLEFVLFDSAELKVCISFCRSALLADDARAVRKSLKSLKENGLQYEIEKQAPSLFRTAAITARIATFLANLEEFCLIKRRLWMKGKQLISPFVADLQPVCLVSERLDNGSRTWRRSSGSFSTMMRFIQRSKEKFKWQSDFAICILT
jgi:hypothetical protein